jgi:hypothetical protein
MHRHTENCCNECGGHKPGTCDGCDRRARREAKRPQQKKGEPIEAKSGGHNCKLCGEHVPAGYAHQRDYSRANGWSSCALIPSPFRAIEAK